MTEKKPTDNRRKLLKSIAAGTGAIVAGKSLPESWSKPVVDAVMLPAHAETTGVTIVNYFDASASRTRIGEGAGEFGIGPIWVCASSDGENVTITYQGKSNNSRNMVVVPINGTAKSTIIGNSTDCESCLHSVTINSISDEALDFSALSTDENGCEPGYGFRTVVSADECGTPPTLDGDCKSSG